jgi:hypothetical protein
MIHKCPVEAGQIATQRAKGLWNTSSAEEDERARVGKLCLTIMSPLKETWQILTCVRRLKLSS